MDKNNSRPQSRSFIDRVNKGQALRNNIWAGKNMTKLTKDLRGCKRQERVNQRLLERVQKQCTSVETIENNPKGKYKNRQTGGLELFMKKIER